MKKIILVFVTALGITMYTQAASINTSIYRQNTMLLTRHHGKRQKEAELKEVKCPVHRTKAKY